MFAFVLAALACSAASGCSRGNASPGPRAFRIMPLGDSITESGCQTQLTWQRLHEDGRVQFDFIGTKRNSQSCGVGFADRDSEGHGGYRVTDLVGAGPRAAELERWARSGVPDVILMHFGTNDVWGQVDTDSILAAFTGVLDVFRRVNPNVALFVAQIVPMNPPNCGDCYQRVQALNARIPGWARSAETPASPVYVVDQWSDFDLRSDTDDGVHPVRSGARKMAERWYAALSFYWLPEVGARARERRESR